jgi:hypothetical protein
MEVSLRDSWLDFDGEGQFCHLWLDIVQPIITAMMTSVLIVTVFLLLVWGLERNHRQPGRPRWVDRDVVGRADAADRDWARIVADLRATDRS